MAFSTHEPSQRIRHSNGGGERSRRHRTHSGMEFAPVAASVRHARQHVRETIEGRVEPETVGAVELLVSELATNAIVHARTPFAVEVALQPARLRVEIHDRAETLPSRRDVGLLETAGRGINIVEAFADRWGSCTTPTGKAVWFEFDR